MVAQEVKWYHIVFLGACFAIIILVVFAISYTPKPKKMTAEQRAAHFEISPQKVAERMEKERKEAECKADPVCNAQLVKKRRKAALARQRLAERKKMESANKKNSNWYMPRAYRIAFS